MADDNPVNVRILAASLQKAGYDVLTVDNGDAAVQVATAQHPDVILLDMQMPGRDGLGVCVALKAQDKTASIPIIFVTAVSEAETMLKGFDAGGVDYVTKPFRTAEVLARVSVHARLHRAETALREKKAETETRARELSEVNKQLASLTRLDPLTGLVNRRAWEESLEQEH
ncbi:MAG: response regulator, partial [Phycisphaerae bacterium]